MNHGFVRAASRRAGSVFTFAGTRTAMGNFGNRYSAKLTTSVVADMRAWACSEGWRMTRVAQVDVLLTRYTYVSRSTINDVLSNNSWRDASYVPGRPDAKYWTVPVPLLVLRLLEES